MIRFKQFISESSLTTLYHGGSAFTKWDPTKIGHGEGMSFLALGPGLYAGNTPQLAGLYTKYAKDGIISELLVDTHRFYDPRKATPSHMKESVEKADAALDAMGLKATTRGIKMAMRGAPRHQWQDIRKALVEAGIDGMWEQLQEGVIEYCIYNPAAIKKISKHSELKEFADSHGGGRGKPRLQIFFKNPNQYEDVYQAFKKFGATIEIGRPSSEGYRVLNVWYGDEQKMNHDQLEAFIEKASPGIKLSDYGFYF